MPDGSVYFEMPSDTWVYFPLLDDKGMMVQSMRSGMIVQPGETIGCEVKEFFEVVAF